MSDILLEVEDGGVLMSSDLEEIDKIVDDVGKLFINVIMSRLVQKNEEISNMIGGI